MKEKYALSKVVMHITRGCLVVPIQIELYDAEVIQIQESVLEKIKETGIKGIIIDVSAVEIMDSFIAQTISDTARMASMMGAATVLVGLNLGVAASLVDLELELGDIQTAITLEEGFRKLRRIVEPKEPEEIEDLQEKTSEEEGAEAEEAGAVDNEATEGVEDDEESEEEEFEYET